jgi:hypothetical protein
VKRPPNPTATLRQRREVDAPTVPSPLLFSDSGRAPDEPWSWSKPTRRAQCPTCGEVFSTDANFDRHLTPGRNEDGFDGPWCQDPSQRGLVKDERGVWKRPAESSAVVAHAPQSGAAAPDPDPMSPRLTPPSAMEEGPSGEAVAL